jgi:hypothetical protein
MFVSFSVKLMNFPNTIVSLSPGINKSVDPFVVHTNVWGPSRVVSLSGYRWFFFLLIIFVGPSGCTY